MAITRLKTADKTPTTGEADARATVARMLEAIEREGEPRVRDYARQFDRWEGPIVVDAAAIAAARDQVSPQLRDDVAFAHERVQRFAARQRAALVDFEVELTPGVFAGQKQIPVTTAGCYVPGGRYAHVASAIMSVTTARAAGVRHVIAASPASAEKPLDPAILYALDYCGADIVLQLGGVQAIGALAFGLFTGRPADLLVGPGNRYVAEAKRHLYGRVGIDLFAGPTEIAIIADASADPHLVAVDLVGQLEHGVDSPAWLVTTDRALAEAVLTAVPSLIDALPPAAAAAAAAAWRDYGEVVLCDTRAEAVDVSDRWAPEHLEVHAADLPWWLDRLSNYGSLFLGPETTVAFGDKCSGTNHILPTKGAAAYTGGLSVGKFIKTVTYQRLDPAAVPAVAAVTARLSRAEGMEAHARSADERLRRYGP